MLLKQEWTDHAAKHLVTTVTRSAEQWCSWVSLWACSTGFRTEPPSMAACSCEATEQFNTGSSLRHAVSVKHTEDFKDPI